VLERMEAESRGYAAMVMQKVQRSKSARNFAAGLKSAASSLLPPNATATATATATASAFTSAAASAPHALSGAALPPDFGGAPDAASVESGHLTLQQSEAWADELASSVFKKLDTDESKKISIKELLAMMDAGTAGSSSSTAVLLFAALDTDQDGQIGMKELRDGMIDAGTGHPALSALLQVVKRSTPEEVKKAYRPSIV